MYYLCNVYTGYIYLQLVVYFMWFGQLDPVYISMIEYVKTSYLAIQMSYMLGKISDFPKKMMMTMMIVASIKVV
jgi:hypothetical protein